MYKLHIWHIWPLVACEGQIGDFLTDRFASKSHRTALKSTVLALIEMSDYFYCSRSISSICSEKCAEKFVSETRQLNPRICKSPRLCKNIIPDSCLPFKRFRKNFVVAARDFVVRRSSQVRCTYFGRIETFLLAEPTMTCRGGPKLFVHYRGIKFSKSFSNEPRYQMTPDASEPEHVPMRGYIRDFFFVNFRAAFLILLSSYLGDGFVNWRVIIRFILVVVFLYFWLSISAFTEK